MVARQLDEATPHPFDVGVDQAGVLHPLGQGAREALRPGARYRLTPWAQPLLMLRELPGEPGAGREGNRAPPVRLAGEISAPGVVCDIFTMVAQLGWRGALVLTDSSARRALYVEEGNVLGAETSVPDERLGSVMYRYGVLSDEDQRRIAAAAAEGGGRFGALAVELGILTQEDVYRCLRHQIEEIAYAGFALAQGTFCFLGDFDSARLVSLQRIPAQGLVMDGLMRLDEIRYFREKIPNHDYVPYKTSRDCPPAPEHREAYAAVDGTSSVKELGRRTGRGEFATTKALFGLERSGHVRLRPPEGLGGISAFVEAVNEILRAAHLEVADGSSPDELAGNLQSFVTSTEPLRLLLERVLPAPDGSLPAEALLAARERLPAEGGFEKALFDYVSFAIFCVGAAVGWEREVALSERVAGALKRIEPR